MHEFSRRAALATLFAVSFACAGLSAQQQWKADIAIDPGEKLGGCTVGDVMPERPGLEIVATARDGRIFVIWNDGKDWLHEVVHQAAGEMIQVAVGDVSPEHPGNEILCVGMKEGKESREGEGVAIVLTRGSDGWKADVVVVAPRLLHGVCVANGTAFVTGYDNAVTRVDRVQGAWKAQKLVDLPAAGKAALPAAGGIVIACTDGALQRVAETNGQWTASVLDKREEGRARLGTDGHRLIVSDNDGVLSVLEPDMKGTWQRREIHHEDDRLRGAILADLDPLQPGLEAATCGYAKRITLLRYMDGHWWSRPLFTDTERFHSLACGDVDGEPGLELIGCGYSGRIVVLRAGPR